jgi:hypothetical protein
MDGAGSVCVLPAKGFSSARFRFENARRSYRSSFSSSGKARIKQRACRLLPSVA